MRSERETAAQAVLRQPCELAGLVRLPRGAVESWRGRDVVPVPIVSFHVRDDGAFQRIDDSWAAFASMIREGEVAMDDWTLLGELLALAPRPLRLVADAALVPRAYADRAWKPSVLAEGGCKLYALDYQDGLFVKVVLAEGRVTIDAVGPGPRLRRR